MSLIALPFVNDAISIHNTSSAQQINSTNMTSDQAGRFYEQGNALLGLEQTNEAIGLFDKALAIDPNNTDALTKKGQALTRLENYSGAIGLFDKALAIDPSNIDALYRKGIAFDSLQNYSGAIGLFDRVSCHRTK